MTQAMEALSYDDAMITGFPPSPFVERPVRNVINLIGAALGFLAAILVIVAATERNSAAVQFAAGSGLASMLLLFGSIAVFADERAGAALVVGGGVSSIAQAVQVVIELHNNKGGPAVPVSAKLIIAAGIVAIFATLLSFPALRTKGNSIIAAMGAIGGLLFAVSEIYVARHLPATRLLQFAAPFVIVALVMIVTPFLGRVGALAALATAIPFVQSAAVDLRTDIGRGDLFRFGVPAALLLIIAAAFVLGLVAASSNAAPNYVAAGPYGYAPMSTASQPAVLPNGMWAPTMPGAPVQVVGTGTAMGTPDPWNQPGQESSVSVLATTVVPVAPAVVNVANPARWEADPYGRFEKRYWDGTRWTEHVSSKGSAILDPIG